MSDFPTDAREQARHNASVMIAFADGKEIQVSPKGDDEWWDCENPTWRFVRFDYRVKPEERKPIEVELWVDDNSRQVRTSQLLATMRKALFREVLPETETE